MWERGSKLFATEAEPVNPHTRACFWQQYLRQVRSRDPRRAGGQHYWPKAALLAPLLATQQMDAPPAACERDAPSARPPIPWGPPNAPPIPPQTATVYQENGVFVAKEYVFKVQSVKARGRGGEDRRTVGKVRVDLAQFCNAEVEPLPKEVFFQLK